MIRRLQVKLICVSMLSLLIVLAFLIGHINISNYSRIVSDADGVLALLQESGGSMEQPPANIKKHDTDRRAPSPELPFETRYFSVKLSSDGTVLSSETAQIASVDDESAREYAQQLAAKKRDSGFIGDFRYLRYADDDGICILFLHCGRVLAGFRDVLLNSVGVSLAGLLSVLTLVVLLSGRIVKPVAESYEKQKRFITDAGHELKTPLSIIDADVALIEMETGEREWLTDVRRQTRRLADLTNELISLSRMEEGVRLSMIDFPVSDLVLETAAPFQAPALARGLNFRTEIAPMLELCGNEKSISQLVSILLDNAVKYTDEGGDVFLRLQPRGKYVRLSVENTVHSLSSETMKNMFERFYRGDPSRNSLNRGYGIGLSIAKAIVQAHRGKISARKPTEDTLEITALLPVQGKKHARRRSATSVYQKGETI